MIDEATVNLYRVKCKYQPPKYYLAHDIEQVKRLHSQETYLKIEQIESAYNLISKKEVKIY